eukprot:1019869-Prymnesium_polylepis.2
MAALRRASRVEFARAVSEDTIVLPTQEPEQAQWLQEQAAADAADVREAHRQWQQRALGAEAAVVAGVAAAMVAAVVAAA